jgi:peroxiredoxin
MSNSRIIIILIVLITAIIISTGVFNEKPQKSMYLQDNNVQQVQPIEEQQQAEQIEEEKFAVVGEEAPIFEFSDLRGGTISLEDLREKIVVLEWTNYDCPFVQKHYDSDNMQSLQDKYDEDNEVVWISIISSAEGKQGYFGTDQEFLTQASFKGALPDFIIRDVDGSIGKSYRAATTPHMFVIDQQGILRYAGAIDSIASADQDDLEKATEYVTPAIEAIKQGKEVEIASTKPYGCSVKY